MRKGREALGAYASLLETVKGHGYRVTLPLVLVGCGAAAGADPASSPPPPEPIAAAEPAPKQAASGDSPSLARAEGVTEARVERWSPGDVEPADGELLASGTPLDQVKLRALRVDFPLDLAAAATGADAEARAAFDAGSIDVSGWLDDAEKDAPAGSIVGQRHEATIWRVYLAKDRGDVFRAEGISRRSMRRGSQPFSGAASSTGLPRRSRWVQKA